MERRAPFVLALILFLLGTSVGQDDVGRTKGRVAPAAIQNPTHSSVAPAKNRPSAASAQKTQALVNYSRLPLSFEPNRGQAGSPVKFLSRGSAYNLLLTDNEALLALQKQRRKNDGAGGQGNKARLEPTGQTNLRLRFEGANPAAIVSGEDELPGKSNYFIGNDPHQWRSGIPNYARVRYHQVYPGIDVLYYGNQGRLEYDFVVAPGARPQQIGLVIEGAEKLETDAAGNLVLHVDGGAVRFEKPLVYQEIEGQRREIAGGGYLLDKGRVTFRVGDYDHRQPLIIDPVLAFSTYLGGSGDELFILSNIDGAIALDSTGDIYVAGETLSTSFAFPGFPASGYKQSCGTDGTCNSTAPGGPYSDIFIAKLNSTASTVLAFTYLGGSGRDILALTSASGGLVVDTTGVYVSGTTYSSDYPTTAGVFRPTCTIPDACTGAGDGFVTKLDVNLGSLIFSTYLSGNGTSQAGQMQVDSTGDVYVIGQAEGGYPTTTSLTPCTPVGTCLTGFVSELNNTGTGQVFSTFLGGSGQDFVDALALDSSNNVYVVGATTSTDFPGQKTLLPAATSGGIFTSTNGTTWTALNSGLAGLNVEAVAVNPATPTTLIAGTGQGIFQSTNSGTTWTLVSAVINVTSIAFDPLNPLNVYAANLGGVLKSTDGGTWVPISGSPGGSSNIAVDPNNEGTVYAGTQGQGLWKSTDGGTSWTQVQSSSGLTAGYINAIVIDPTNSANVYVGSPGQGVFASTNGGANWSQMNNGLITNSGTAPAIRALAIDPNNHTTLYAGTAQGIFKTTNSAGTWTQVSNGLTQGAGTVGIRAVAVDPANSQNVYAGSGSAGLFFSSNGGTSWSLLNNLGPHIISALALHAASGLPTTIYAGTGYEFAFAAKINSGGGSLAYATLLGGNAQTYLWGIALDSSTNAYLGGQTYASNFPVSGTAFQKNLLGLSNGLVAKLNSSGNSLTYASYLGGSGSDTAYSIALDGNQQAWLTGATSSDDFPLANGIWLQSPGNHGNSNEAFITQVNAAGTGLLFSTYLGGEGNCKNCNGPFNSEGVDITVDPGGNAYVMGFTNDNSFVTANALQPAPGGGYDAFVAKIGSVTTVTDLSICLLDSSGQCTTTPPAAVVAGADFVINLQVTNKSTTTSATGVVVGGRGGNGIRAIACTVSVGTCAPDNSSITIPNGGFASLGTLAPGATAQISVTLVGSQAGSFVVTVDVRENETDANPADNSASTTLTVIPGADLAVTLSATPSPSPVQVGGTLIYIANVANLGPSNASNVTAVFTLEPTTAATFVLPLPSGCSNIVAGTLTCVLGPMPAGTAGPGTIPVTVNSLPITAGIVVSNSPEADPDPANNVASVTTTLSASAVNNAELNGQYAFLLRGFDPSGQAIAIGGSFTADGAGHITGGVKDVNIQNSAVAADLSITAAGSSYSVGADHRGMLTLTTSAGTETFDFSVGSISSGVASLGHIISRRNTSATNGSAISGVFKKQDSTAFTLTALNGDWAFLNEGVDGSGGRFANAGRFTLSGGNLTLGSYDFNDNGVFDNGTTTASTFTGSFGSLDTTNGRAPLTTTVLGSGSTDEAVYIVSASEVLFMSIDPISTNPLAGGSALRQSTTFCPTTGNCNFANSALNGNAVIYTQGNSSSGVAGAADVNVGVLTFTLATTSFSGSLDENDGGTIYCPAGNICANPGGSTASGNYSVASNGRVTLTLGGGENNPPFFYMVNTNQAFLIGSSSGHVEAGVAENQVGPIAAASGGSAFGTEPPAVSASLMFSGVQTITAAGSTTASLTSTTNDVNSVGPIPDVTRGGLHEDVSIEDDTLTLDPTTGRFTFASGTKVGYFVNSTRRVAIDIETTNTAPYVIISDNQSSSISPPAGTLYSTGFENPPFTLGNLSGQDGWQASSVCGLTGPATGLVENTLVQSGSQAVSVDGSVTCQSGPYHSDSSTGPLIELSAGIYIASSSSQTQWQFAGLGPGLAPFIGGVGILGTGQIVAITAGLPTVGTWTYNAWNNLDFLFNFSTQTYAITLNGVPLASGVPFCGDNGACAGAHVSTYGTSLFDTFGGGNDTGYIDNFSLSNPALAISTISPTSAAAGSGAFTLTVNGAGFVSGATVNFNGNPRATTFVSATQLTAAILASDIATAGNVNVTVTNPAGGGTSAPAVFVVSAANPVPTITTISPTSAVAGGAAFTLTVNGTGFVSTSAVNFGANAPVTTFVSAAQLTAAIPALDIATAGNVNVTVVSPGPGGGTSNIVTFTVGTVAATADLAVAMTASPSPVPVLGSVTYQITVTNNGPNPATGVVLTDTLPAGTVFASIDDLTDCVVSNGTLTCRYSSLAVGSPQAVNLILVPLAVPSGAGTFDNTASVAANETDPNLANNSATQTVQVTGTTLPGGGAFRSLPGFSNSILPGNDDNSVGPVPLSPVPGNLNLNFFGVQVSSVFVNNNGNVTFGSPLGTFTPFPLTTTNVQIIAPYFSDVETDFPTSGLVTYGNDTVNGRPAFGVNWPNVEYFGEGPATLLNLFQLVLVDRSDVGAGNFDIEFNYNQVQWETGDASGGVGGLGGSSARVGYSNGSQTAGSFFELPGSGMPGSFLDSNTTTGLIHNDLNNTQPGRYLFQVRGGTVQSSADMAISANGPPSAATGSTITYTLTATNLGPNTATGVTVTDTLPAGFTFVSATPSNICSPAGQPVVVTCNVGSLADGSNAIITIQASIPTTASGTATDTAVVSVPNNQDLNLGNNTATVMTNITVLAPDLTIIKTHNDPFAQGQTGATYTITVTNSGTGATTGTVTVNDALPTGLTATAISGTNWTCTLQPLGCTRSDVLAAGASYDPITLTVTVAANATLGQVTNTATVSGGGEVNTANDTASDVTNIVAAAAALVPTVAVIPPPDATGTTISYTVTITNNGPSAATSVTLTDQLTGNAGFVSATSATMTCPTTPSATSLNCTLAVLNNGASVTVTITVNLTGAGWDLNAIGVTSPVPNPNPAAHTLTVQKLTPGGNTVTGSDVAVQPMDSTSGGSPAVLTFADVTRGGITTLASAASGPAPPAGFRTGTPAVFYNLATTAGYAGTIGVALSFNAASFHHAAKVRLFHSENGAWVDRTVAINPTGAYAVARVTSLSPFALFEPINHIPEAKAGLDLSTVATSAQGAKVTLNGSASFDADQDPLTYRWTGPFPEGNGVATGVSPTVTMPPGGSTVTLVVNDGEADSAPATQNIIVTDFSMAAAASGPTTISAGASVGFSVTASPQFGPFPPAIALACLGLPQGAQCNFSTTSVNAGGPAATLTISTTPRTAAALAPLRHRNPAPLYTLWMPLPAIALMGLGLRRRSRKRAATLMLLLLLGMTLLLVSCGGGSMGTTPPLQNGTPAGTFTVTVTGTANGSLQHTTGVTFTVQ